jgi:hypothetical protein
VKYNCNAEVLNITVLAVYENVLYYIRRLAIDCHIHDLQGAKDMVIQELGGAKLKFSGIDEGIKSAISKK